LSVGEISSALVDESFGVGVGCNVGFGVTAWVGVGVGVSVGAGVGVGVEPVIATVSSVDQTDAELQLGVYLPTLNRYSPGPL
jgi:hypothetical protein